MPMVDWHCRTIRNVASCATLTESSLKLRVSFVKHPSASAEPTACATVCLPTALKLLDGCVCISLADTPELYHAMPSLIEVIRSLTSGFVLLQGLKCIKTCRCCLKRSSSSVSIERILRTRALLGSTSSRRSVMIRRPESGLCKLVLDCKLLC